MASKKRRTKTKAGSTTQRIVTHEMGSWKWQDAYCVATYEARPDRQGRLRWYSVEHGPKRSRPQLDRMGITDELTDVGSIHRRLVSEVAA